ncbi:ranBP2-like and GRIP domain-containing protein 4 isoform X2 [Planococcus citri]|uniref:ranBP2-like and GRIP domain-containing protein 4 isoform X2 n=1 Tax=Planococcus citri TaxID=170843 RepID=UPI0031FA289B
MFRTKKDVDRHSQEVLQKITNEKERNLRCLSIAQLYYNVHDYESAKRYLLMYLSVKDDSPLAHKLLGQIYEQLNDKYKALQEFIVSFQADSKQPELALKICELICENEIFDKSQAKQWFPIGEKHFTYHPTILKLKKKLFLVDDDNYTSLEASLKEQIRNKPNSPELHIQLLTFYLENGRIREAYEEAFQKPRHFTPIMQWYQCAIRICKMYKIQYPNSLQEDFYANNLLSLERLLALAVQDVKLTRKGITECVSFLARFDETLSDAVLLLHKSLKFQRIINHMCGQLCFHAASIIYRKLKWEDVKSSKEFNQLTSPLLLLSTSKDFKIVEDRSTNDSLYRTYNVCVIENAYRILQSEIVLHGMAQGNVKEFIESIFRNCVGDYWKERISEKIYSTSDYMKFRKSSFFMTYAAFSNLPAELSPQVLENIEKKTIITETVNPISLHHLVWFGVNYLMLSDKKSLSDMYLHYQFYARKFSALPFCNNLSSSTTYAESLCRLDVDAFLYACVFCAKSYIDQQITSDRYHIFPADVSKAMCSTEQEQWWEYAYQMCSKTIPDSGIPSSRSTLQRGIEAVRLSGCSSLPLPLLVLLGRTFSNRAAVESDSDIASSLEERAALYWKTALPLLENIARNQTITNTPKSIFEYHGSVITKATAVTLIEEGKRIVGMHLIKSNDYSDSVCEQINESYADLNASIASSNAGVSVAATLWGDKIIQTMLQQNAKITDKLETLFNKQELLCSNQFQLLEMISTLTKKVEALIIPDYDEYLDKLAVNQSMGPSESSLPTGLTSSWTPAPVSCLQQQLQAPHQMLPNNVATPKAVNNISTSTFMQTPPQFNYGVPNFGSNSIAPRTAAAAATASFMQKHPHLNATPNAYVGSPVQMGFNATSAQWDLSNVSLNSGVQSLAETTSQPSQVYSASSISSKLEPSYGAVSGYLSSQQQQQQQQPPFQQPSSTPLSTSLFAPQQQLAGQPFTFSFSSPTPASINPPGTPGATVAGNTGSSPSVSFSTPISTTFGSATKSSTTISGTPPTSTATPARPSYHIPMPDSSVVQPSPPMQIPQDEDDDDEVEPVEHDPIPDFKPIIPLPDEVVVKTGEEGEQVVYENRVKLFRFVDKEWKERGIGTYKLLKNPDTGRVRALMRREMVHKVCANHLLSEKNELTPMKSSDRAWIYCAADYADGEMKFEQFCIKFKTPEDAAKFKTEFDKYRDESVLAAGDNNDSLNKSTTATSTSVLGTSTPPSAKSAEPKATVVSTETPKKSNDTSKFTPRSGLLFGTPTTPKTESPVAQSAPTVAKTTPAAAKPFGSESTFVFGAPKLPSSPASAAASPATAPAKSAETTKPSVFAGFGGFSMNTLPKPTASITNLFQQQQQQQQPPSSTATKSESATTEPAPFTCVSDDAMTFSSLSQSSGNAFAKSKDFKGFQGAGSLVFGGVAAKPSAPVAAILKNILPLSPQLNTSNVSTSGKADESGLNESTAASSGGAGDEDEFVPTQEFSPVIPLPELIDVKTGEEGQEVLYEERCKLYRYTGEEWKERGVGNMKILRDPVSGYVRLLMRREQVHKVCCNHRLLKEHELKKHSTSDKAWTWCAQDYSENELKNETFCVKFKHTEQANAFRDAFNRAKSNLESPQKASSSDSASSKTKTAEAALPKLSDMFKPETGSWECKMCYVRNKGDIDTCLSCASPRNPSEQKSSPEEGKKAEPAFVDNKSLFSSGGGASKFSFGMPASNKQDTSSVTPTPTPAAAPAAPAKEFSFGLGAPNVSSSSSSPAVSFSFGTGSSLFNFGNSPGAVTQPAVTKDSGFSFAPVVSQVQSATPSTTPTVTNTSSTFTPIASSPKTGSTEPVFSFGKPISLSPSVSIFKTPAGAPGSSTPFQSLSAGKPQENATIFGGGAGSTTLSTSFSFGGKAQENASIFGGEPFSKTSSIFGSPDSSKSANTSGAFSNFSFKLPADVSITTVDKAETSSQDSIPFYERVPLLINDKNEIKLFKSRAMLYRCEEHKEEEELGRGYLYILKNPTTCKFRLLFMKKPGLLACLSHFVDEKMTIESLDEFSWSWFASDFSKAEIIDCFFRVIFDDTEAATEFKSSVDKVQKEIRDGASDSPALSEVEFVSETKPSEEEKKLAESLRLPSNFFAYKYQKDCPGCVGCDEEDKKLKQENKENQSSKTVSQSSLFSNNTTPKTSLFGGFNIPSNDSKPSPIFGDITNNTSWLSKGPFSNSLNLSAGGSPAQKATQEGSDDDDEVVKNDQDPYFEPVIPLPDIVEVKTGEENEEIKFCERAKLFRYDIEDKQWKERGVGELKVLYHPVEKSYRLLLRREQVHKVVLNQRITNYLNLQPLSSSRSSWCWSSMNFPEQESEPVLEKLAAKFKTEAQATAFHNAVQESLFDINTVQNDESAATTTNVSNRNESGAASSDVDDDDDRDYGEGNYDDTNYEEYDDREYEDGDDEYEPDYYVDEDAIGDAMEELDVAVKEVLFENNVNVEVVQGDTSANYEGGIKLVKKYDDDKEDDVGCIVFSTPEVPAMYKADIVEGMNMIHEGEGVVSFVELNSDEYEKKMILKFENEDIAEEFAASFRTLNIPAAPKNH